MYNEIREAAEVHRQTRAYAERHIRPGMTMLEICKYVIVADALCFIADRVTSRRFECGMSPIARA